MANTPPPALNASPASPPPLIDRQGWWNLLAGMLLILISFTTNFSDGDLHDFSTLALNDQIAICLHLAALAALASDVELASRLRYRATYEAARERDRSAEREQRQNRSLRAGALFLLDPNPLHRRFLAYIANELASPSATETPDVQA
jgi:hypothetical protein